MVDRKARILCVDDHEDTCEMIATILSDYRMKTATGAARGLFLARTELFDLYLLDNWLPDLSGVELCRKIRAFDVNTPIIFYSGAAYDSDRQEALAAGAQVYLTKPTGLLNLRDAVAQLILQAEMRSLEARMAEIAAVNDGIKDNLEQAEERLRKAREAMLKNKAFATFIAAGGTRAHFEYMWPELLRAEFQSDDQRM
jgi:two-component system, sensor histidine kinase ChiS